MLVPQVCGSIFLTQYKTLKLRKYLNHPRKASLVCISMQNMLLKFEYYVYCLVVMDQILYIYIRCSEIEGEILFRNKLVNSANISIFFFRRLLGKKIFNSKILDFNKIDNDY